MRLAQLIVAALIVCQVVAAPTLTEAPRTELQAPVINPENVLPGPWFTPTGARN